VLKVPPTDPACATSCIQIGSGLSYPTGIAVDGAGNVYIADQGNSQVLLETLSGGSYTQSVVANGSTKACIIPMAWRWMAAATSTSPTYGTSRCF